LGDKIKEIGKACGKYWGPKRCIHCFDGESEARYQLEESGIDGRIILKWSF